MVVWSLLLKANGAKHSGSKEHRPKQRVEGWARTPTAKLNRHPYVVAILAQAVWKFFFAHPPHP